MKIFGVDASAKYIFFEIDGRKYSILFRNNLRRGVHVISVWEKGKEADVKITGKYPPLKDVVRELWRIHFPLWIARKVRKCRQLRNR